MATTVRELLVKLGFDVDDKKLKNWQQSAADGAKKFGKEFAKAAKVVVVGAAAAAVGIFKLVDSATKSGDAIAKGARAAGITTDSFQKLQFMAGRSGVQMEVVAKSVRKLTQSLHDVATGNASPKFISALNEIGVTMAELEGLSPEKQMGVLADALNGVQDPATRTALAMEILGARGGPQLASLLELGSEGMSEMTAEAQRLGLILDKETLAATEEFQDQLGDMKAVIGAVGRDIGLALMPSIKEVIVEVREWVLANKDLIKEKVGEFIQKAIDAAREWIPVVKDVVSWLGSFVSVVHDLVKVLGPEGAVAAFVGARLAMAALGTGAMAFIPHILAITAAVTAGTAAINMFTKAQIDALDANTNRMKAENRKHAVKFGLELEGMSYQDLLKRRDELDAMGITKERSAKGGIRTVIDKEIETREVELTTAVKSDLQRTGQVAQQRAQEAAEAWGPRELTWQEKMAAEKKAARRKGGAGKDKKADADKAALGLLNSEFGDDLFHAGKSTPKDKKKSVLELLEKEFGGKSFHAGGGVMDSRPTLGTTINRVTNEYSPKVDVAITANQRPGESTGEFAERVKSMLQDELGKMHRRGYDHFLGAVVG